MTSAAPASTLGGAPLQLGRYELIHPLGAGGMARVYLGVQRGPVAAKLVVVKVLRPEFAHEPDFVAMFVDESRVLVRLNHPNVVHTYEAASDDDHYFIVMEFLEGKTLGQLLNSVGREKMPLGLHLWILTEVLAGLRYAHELCDFDGTSLDIVHRDVSPSNVFVTRAGGVKLLDFGIAKVAGAVSATRQGVLKGNIGYISPEQCLGRQTDARSDIYSVGVMLWEAITGRRLASGDGAVAKIQARVTDGEPDVAEVSPDVAPELAQIVRRALAFDAAQRYPTAAAFHAELSEYRARLGSGVNDAAAAELLGEHFDDELTHLRKVIGDSVRVGSVAPTSLAEPAPVPQLRSSIPQPPAAAGLAPSRVQTRSVRIRLRYLVPTIAAVAVLCVTAWYRSAPHDSGSAHAAPVIPSLAAPRDAPTASTEAATHAEGDASNAPEERRNVHTSGKPGRAPTPLKAASSSRPRSSLRTSAGANSGLEPGSDLRLVQPPAARPQRSLDERDPY